MKCFLYVESPFQLLQAYELICNNTDSTFNLLIRLNKNNIANKQLYNLVKLFGFGEFVTFVKDYGKVMVPWIALRVFVSYLVSQKLYIGDENSRVFKLLRFGLRKNKVILLDDGSATLNTRYANIYKRFTIFTTNYFAKNNGFFNLKKLLSSSEAIKKRDIIIGQTIAEDHCGICSPAVYEKYLALIIKECDDNVVYIPHRAESVENVDRYRKKFGFDVVRLGLPIELIQLEKGIKPKRVYGCISTAFFSLDILYDDISFSCYRFKESSLKNLTSEIKVFYDYLAKLENIEVFDI